MNDSLHTTPDSTTSLGARLAVRLRVQLWATVLWAILLIGSWYFLVRRIVPAIAVRPEEQNVPLVYFDKPSDDFEVLTPDRSRMAYRVPVGTAWVEAKAIPQNVYRYGEYAIVLSWKVSGKGYVQTFDARAGDKNGILERQFEEIVPKLRERLAVVVERSKKKFAAELVRSSGKDVVVHDSKAIGLIALMLSSTLIWLAMTCALVVNSIKRRLRIKRGRCASCAYPQLVDGTKCPECGLDY